MLGKEEIVQRNYILMSPTGSSKDKGSVWESTENLRSTVDVEVCSVALRVELAFKSCPTENGLIGARTE